MKITIDVSTMQNRFAACGRDYYSWEGYEALLAYYNDIDPNMELDAVAICGDGLEVLTQCSTMREAKADRKAYIENEHICPMIRKRRYPIHNNTVC